MAVISSIIPYDQMLLDTINPKKRQSIGKLATGKKVKLDHQTSYLPLPNDVLQLIFSKYIGWGNKDCLAAAQVCRQFRRIVGSLPLQALVNSCLSFRGNYDPEVTFAPRVELRALGTVTKADTEKLELILDKWDLNESGFRRLLFEDLKLCTLAPWKKFILEIWDKKIWFPGPTAEYTEDPEIKKIALNAQKALKLFQTNPSEWTKVNIDCINWKELPKKATDIKIEGQFDYEYLDKLVENKIPAITQNLENQEFIIALFDFAKSNRVLTNSLFRLLNEKDKQDRKLLFRILSVNGMALEHMPDPLKQDQAFVWAAFLSDHFALTFAGPELRKDRNFMLRAVIKNGLALEHAHNDLRNDEEIVWEAVKQNGLALQFASDIQKRKRAIVLHAVKQNGLALEFVFHNDKRVKSVLMAAIRQNGVALEHAPPVHRRNKAIVLEAVRQNGLALEHAHEDLQDDEDVVTAAVFQNGLALEFASERLRGHKKIEQGNHRVIQKAVKQNGRALEFTSYRYKFDRGVVTDAVKQYGKALKLTYYENRNDFKVVLAAVSQNGLALEYASPKMRRNRSIVIAAVNNDGWALQFADETLLNDPEIIAIAKKQIAFG